MFKEIENIALSGLASVFELRRGSLRCILKVSSLSALEEIWLRYKNGQLKKSFEKVFVTDKIRHVVGDESLSLDIEISPESYRAARLDLKMALFSQLTGGKTFLNCFGGNIL